MRRQAGPLPQCTVHPHPLHSTPPGRLFLDRHALVWGWCCDGASWGVQGRGRAGGDPCCHAVGGSGGWRLVVRGWDGGGRAVRDGNGMGAGWMGEVREDIVACGAAAVLLSIVIVWLLYGYCGFLTCRVVSSCRRAFRSVPEVLDMR